MPELTAQSTTPPVPPPTFASEAPPAAIPPPVDPLRWEDFAVFRETFLAYFTRQGDADAFRHLGNLMFEMLLEHCRNFPDAPESVIRWELRAAVADLRHAQGFLQTLGNQHRESSLTPQDAALSRYAGLQSLKLRRLADRIEQRLMMGS